MALWLVLIILTVLVTGGVWGAIILFGLFKVRTLKLNRPPDDPRVDELSQDFHQLEGRLERLEEEIGFFRELRQPEGAPQLPDPEKSGSPPKT